MNIIDTKAFLKMPKNTVFSKYEPCTFFELNIKGESLENDFFYQPIADSFDIDRSESLEGIPTDLNIESRDGCFEKYQLFAIWSKEDVSKLINRLKECI